MAVLVDTDLEVRIAAFNELLDTLRACAGRGLFFSIDDIQRAIKGAIIDGEVDCAMMTMFLAIAIQRSVFS